MAAFTVKACFCLAAQSDRRRAQTAMEDAWKSMEKKEKIPWIKKAAEDQKRYEVPSLKLGHFRNHFFVVSPYSRKRCD